jgi:hypothetical protein
VARDIVVKFGARPMNAEASDALADPQYREGMVAYGKELSRLLDPVWKAEVAAKEPWLVAAPGSSTAAEKADPALPVVKS